MKAKLTVLIFLGLFLISCHQSDTKAIHTIPAAAYAQQLSTTPKPQLVDVRTPEEYQVEHLNNAINIDWNGTSFTTEILKLDKTQPIFVYCKVGGRSSEAASKLEALGFTEIYNLEGGIMQWPGKKVTQSTNQSTGMSLADFQKLMASDQKVLVDFYAKWCGPCKKMTPYLLKMQKELAAELTIVRLDADENKTLVDELKLTGLPVIITYENGKETWRNLGYITEEDLKKHL